MKKTILKIVLLVALIVLAVYLVQIIKGYNKGTPNQQNKGNPIAR
ncbi:MAG: hypothetical protein V4594_12190 [Bacteroidota bacterium]